MTSPENRKIVERIFAETAQGNWTPLLEALADDFRFVVTGTSPWARAYDGKAAVLAELFGPLRARLAGKIVNRAVRIIADGEFVVAESRGHNTTTGGKAYHNTYCNVLRLEGGKLKEWTEYADSRWSTRCWVIRARQEAERGERIAQVRRLPSSELCSSAMEIAKPFWRK